MNPVIPMIASAALASPLQRYGEKNPAIAVIIAPRMKYLASYKNWVDYSLTNLHKIQFLVQSLSLCRVKKMKFVLNILLADFIFTETDLLMSYTRKPF